MQTISFWSCFVHHRNDLTLLQYPFGSRLVVRYQLTSRSHVMPVWIVLCPVIPGTWHWKGLTSTVVAVPYAALTTVQHNRLVLPHNSLQGLHSYAMGATRTQSRTLLTLMVLSVQALCPQFRFYLQGRLALTDSTAATLLAK